MPIPTKTTITRNKQEVDCYGEWREDSNFFCVFEDEELDGFWAEGAVSWEDAVNTLTDYAVRNNTVLIELTAC